MVDVLIWVGGGIGVAAAVVAGVVTLAIRAGEDMVREDPYWDM